MRDKLQAVAGDAMRVRTVILSLPEDVVQAAEKAAAANGETLEAYFVRLAGLDAERQATEAFFAARRAQDDLGDARDLLIRPRGEAPGQ